MSWSLWVTVYIWSKIFWTLNPGWNNSQILSCNILQVYGCQVVQQFLIIHCHLLKLLDKAVSIAVEIECFQSSSKCHFWLSISLSKALASSSIIATSTRVADGSISRLLDPCVISIAQWFFETRIALTPLLPPKHRNSCLVNSTSHCLKLYLTKA